MRSHAELVASAPLPNRSPSRWRLTWASGVSPIAFRDTPEAVYLVGTAAWPVGDDRASLSVKVEAGADLVVRSAASSIAWAGNGSSLDVSVEVEEGAHLDWQLQPLVATSRCQFSQHVKLAIAPGASLRWVEEVVLGRHGEGPGDLHLRLDADIGGEPLLRHALEVGRSVPGWDGAAVLGGHKAVGLELLAGTKLAHGSRAKCATAAQSELNGATGAWASMSLEGPAVLLQAVGADLPALREGLRQAEAAR